MTQQQIVQLEDILGCDIERNMPPCLINVGAKWIVAQVKNSQKVLEIKPDYAKQYVHDQSLGVTGICVYGFSIAEPEKIEVRSFAPACGVNEDPVCGSGNGSVAAFIHHYNKSKDNLTIQSTQGRIAGRDGHLQLNIMNDSIFVGGNAITCINGTIFI